MSATRRKPGRPRKRRDPNRIPMGGLQTNLQLSEQEAKAIQEQGYVTRWFNDLNGRIQAAQAGGWEFVEPEQAKSVGGQTIHDENSDLGAKVSKVVSRSGEPIRAYLMKIHRDFYKEDQEMKEDRNRAVDEGLRPTDQGGQTIEGGYTPG